VGIPVYIVITALNLLIHEFSVVHMILLLQLCCTVNGGAPKMAPCGAVVLFSLIALAMSLCGAARPLESAAHVATPIGRYHLNDDGNHGNFAVCLALCVELSSA